MYKVKWDKESNGILLTDKINGKEEIVPPRPVFFEELELLGFNNYWKYPKTQSPLLWGIGRRYFYKGELVAEAKGGNIFEEPEIVITDTSENLVLEPIDMESIASKNKEALFTLENEAMDFVEHSYKIYKNEVGHSIVSFSGGKDSQVVLDIVSRIIPPDDYVVIFIDTTMELPCTYETVEKTKKTYQKLYPNLRFYTTKHEKEAIELWKKFGPPSMILKWCRSVYKTSPFARFVKGMYKENNPPKILVFEGVRSEESHTRKMYNRISTSRKHIFQINAEVIKDWNISEVFLYLFSRNIEMNRAYRYGLNRVGCSICPFGSKWYEFIINKMFPNLTNEYVHVITDYVKLSGIKDKKNIELYIAEGQWKKRAGGRGVDTNGVRIDFIEKENSLEAVSMRPRENFLEWVKTVGDIIYKNQENRIVGEIKIGSEIFDFEMEKKNDDKVIVRVNNVGRDIIALNKLKKTLYKATYCVNCGTCEVKCPTGALKVIPVVKIDEKYCMHCGDCLNFVDRGCLIAKSTIITPGRKNMEQSSKVATSKYQNFGMRREWGSSFFRNLDDWFSNNNLGPRQVEGMVAWLKDAELLEGKRKTSTEIAKMLKKMFNKDELFVWAIIWVNLYYKSSIIRWYTSDIKLGSKYSTKELKDIIVNTGEGAREKTASNTVSSLMNLFDSNPIGSDLKLGLIEKEKNIRYVRKVGTDNIHPMAVVYSLYKYSEAKKRYDFTVSEFYKDSCDGGPYKLFGISREKFENVLRWAQENKNEMVQVDLTAGLDNIRLREDIDSKKILSMVVENE